MPSLKSLARQLGLSITTVSRALAGYTDVAAETRARVEAAADAAGYRPHPIARQLKGGERVPAEIDLAGFRGREVSIAFIVDPLAEPSGDWATWVTPRVVLR